MSWNYRLLAHIDGEYVYYLIHEVYYDKQGIPNSYTETGVSIGGDNIKEVKKVIDKMKMCIEKPVLYSGDKFPQEYEKQS